VRHVLCVCLLLALAVTASASASRPAKANEARAIRTAVLASLDRQTVKLVRVERIRISTADSHWALAHIVAKPGVPSGRIQSAGELLRRSSSHWNKVLIGGVCSWGVAPRAVLRDLYGHCLDSVSHSPLKPRHAVRTSTEEL
jgi:hypothetical protein